MRGRLPIQVVLAIMTTATVVVWVGFSVYQELKTEPSPKVSKEILQAISPDLDTQTLALINEKLYFERGDTVAFSSQSAIINSVSKAVIIPTQFPENTEAGTESAQVSNEPETASNSAETVQ